MFRFNQFNRRIYFSNVNIFQLTMLGQWCIIIESAKLGSVNWAWTNPFIKWTSLRIWTMILLSYDNPQLWFVWSDQKLWIHPGFVKLAFFYHNLNLIENMFCYHSYSKEVITAKFCTWHDSTAAMVCAKICTNQTASNEITAKNCNRFHTWVRNPWWNVALDRINRVSMVAEWDLLLQGQSNIHNEK